MEIGAMVNQGLIGMQRSQAEMTSSAQQIAQASATPPAQGAEATQAQSAPNTGVVEPLLNMRAQQQVFDSSAEVVKTADENLGRLIDTTA